MKVVYTGDKIDKDCISCFLAGPTPRSSDVSSWRNEAISLFSKYGFSDTLYVPEFREKPYYDVDTGIKEMKWDQEALESSTIVMFWIPRSSDMLGLSTNAEFGYMLNRGNFVYGRPNDAIRCQFLDFLYKDKLGKDYCVTLEETVKSAINYLEGVKYE